MMTFVYKPKEGHYKGQTFEFTLEEKLPADGPSVISALIRGTTTVNREKFLGLWADYFKDLYSRRKARVVRVTEDSRFTVSPKSGTFNKIVGLYITEAINNPGNSCAIRLKPKQTTRPKRGLEGRLRRSG